MHEFPVDLPAILPLEGDRLVMEIAPGEPDIERFPEMESFGPAVVFIVVRRAGRIVCEASFYFYGERHGSFEEIWVHPGERRKGIATAVYDTVESLGITVYPSNELDEDGFLFWQARRAASGRAAVLPALRSADERDDSTPFLAG